MSNYQDPYQPTSSANVYVQQPQQRRHSGLGIASFVLSIVGGLATLGVFVTAGVLEAQTPGGLDEDSPVTMMVGLAVFAAVGLALLGLALGIGGLVQPNRQRIFAILGTIFNGFIILGICGIMALGMAVSGAP